MKFERWEGGTNENRSNLRPLALLLRWEGKPADLPVACTRRLLFKKTGERTWHVPEQLCGRLRLGVYLAVLALFVPPIATIRRSCRPAEARLRLIFGILF